MMFHEADDDNDKIIRQALAGELQSLEKEPGSEEWHKVRARLNFSGSEAKKQRPGINNYWLRYAATAAAFLLIFGVVFRASRIDNTYYSAYDYQPDNQEVRIMSVDDEDMLLHELPADAGGIEAELFIMEDGPGSLREVPGEVQVERQEEMPGERQGELPGEMTMIFEPPPQIGAYTFTQSSELYRSGKTVYFYHNGIYDMWLIAVESAGKALEIIAQESRVSEIVTYEERLLLEQELLMEDKMGNPIYIWINYGHVLILWERSSQLTGEELRKLRF